MDMEKEFKKYVSKFDLNNDSISKKYYHSLRVMNKARKIAESIELSEEYINIATTVGLLHDYGRFEQWKRYHTYADGKSVDHGDLGVEILFDEKEIEKYDIKKENYKIIYNAIKYHNKLEIPENLTKEEKIICKIIRDADKLDIYELVLDGKILFIDDNNPINPEVRKKFFENSSINKKIVKNESNGILLRLALVYDINFNWSIEYIKNNHIIDRMLEMIENKKKYEEYFSYIKKYLG